MSLRKSPPRKSVMETRTQPEKPGLGIGVAPRLGSDIETTAAVFRKQRLQLPQLGAASPAHTQKSLILQGFSVSVKCPYGKRLVLNILALL